MFGKKAKKVVEIVIFNSKWMLILFYLGLILAMADYTWVYFKQLVHIFELGSVMNSDLMTLEILEVVDLVMVGNLIKMILTGSYNSFVSKDHGVPNENLSSGTLKVKMSTSMVGVSSIHLLRTFIATTVDWDEIKKQVLIHVVLLIGSLILAVIDFIHVKVESLEEKHEKVVH